MVQKYYQNTHHWQDFSWSKVDGEDDKVVDGEDYEGDDVEDDEKIDDGEDDKVDDGIATHAEWLLDASE